MGPVSARTRVQEQFCLDIKADSCGIVVFGASGDLAERKLFPALFHLKRTGLLPDKCFIVGAGRTAMTDESFREHVSQSIKKHARAPKPEAHAIKEFLGSFYYQSGDYAAPALYEALAARLETLDKKHGAKGNRLFYLSVPPSLYGKVVHRLGAAKLAKPDPHSPGWSRIIIEKPFGTDQASARELTKEIQKVFPEKQTYRIDHYLGKETVQNVMVLRFANIMFEPLWNRRYVDHVQITVAEELGIGHRAGYYEEAGVLRDMFQNHLLQLLCITAMEPPSSFAANRVRDEKSKVLRALRPFTAGDIDHRAVRGQYGPGMIGSERVVGYTQEPGVAPDSRTESFAAMTLFVDNWRWEGVPFYLRSGKRMAKRLSEIAVQFKPVPHLLFQPLRPNDILPNVLVLRIQPEEGISLCFETKHPGAKLCMSSVKMDFKYETNFGEPPEAYERLFLDCLCGDQTLFTRCDWVDISWALLAPLWERWKNAGPPLYAAGAWGPPEADALLAERGHAWRNG